MGQPGSVSILSFQNIIIVRPSWVYPSSRIEYRSPESRYFGKRKIFCFTSFSFSLFDAVDRIDADADARLMQI